MASLLTSILKKTCSGEASWWQEHDSGREGNSSTSPCWGTGINRNGDDAAFGSKENSSAKSWIATQPMIGDQTIDD